MQVVPGPQRPLAYLQTYAQSAKPKACELWERCVCCQPSRYNCLCWFGCGDDLSSVDLLTPSHRMLEVTFPVPGDLRTFVCIPF